MSDTHYPVQKLSLKKRREILLWSKEHAQRWWVDILDCSVSMRRRPIEMPFEEIMAKFNRRCHFSIIHRQHVDRYLEVGFSTFSDPEYLLWINVPEEHVTTLEGMLNQ